MFIVLISFFIFSIFTGCTQEETMTIEERIRAFVSDLNKSNRDSLKEHFHYTQIARNLMNDAYWAPFVQEGGSYTVLSITETGSNTRSVRIDGGISQGSYYTFNMKKDGDDWMIYSISGTPSVPY